MTIWVFFSPRVSEKKKLEALLWSLRHRIYLFIYFFIGIDVLGRARYGVARFARNPFARVSAGFATWHFVCFNSFLAHQYHLRIHLPLLVKIFPYLSPIIIQNWFENGDLFWRLHRLLGSRKWYQFKFTSSVFVGSIPFQRYASELAKINIIENTGRCVRAEGANATAIWICLSAKISVGLWAT